MNPWVAPSQLPEHTFWTMRKGDTVAEARVRVLTVGSEPCFFIRTDGVDHSHQGLSGSRRRPSQ
jgi:hypothetical protein